MKDIQRNILLFLAFFCCLTAEAQQDTAAMIKDFNKVMSFTVQPYLHYKADIKMSSTPIVQPEDTLSGQSELFKNGNDLNYRSAFGEMFIADSLFIEIDKRHKKITVSRIDENTLKKLSDLPLDNKEMRDLFKKQFSITRESVNSNTGILNFSGRQFIDSTNSVAFNIRLQYSTKDFLPNSIEMDADMKQQVGSEDIQQMVAENPSSKQLIHNENGINYLIRTQRVTLTFHDIDNTKSSVTQMPSWKENINYNQSTGELTPLGMYSDYEIIKNF